jgi:hypothetical protein
MRRPISCARIPSGESSKGGPSSNGTILGQEQLNCSKARPQRATGLVEPLVLSTSAFPQIPAVIAAARKSSAVVESRMGAVAWGLRPTLRFPSPLIKPSVPISGTRLSDWLHHKAHEIGRFMLVSSDDTLGT